MKQFALVVLVCVAAALTVPALRATEGVKGATVRPQQDKAKVVGCRIAKPGAYDMSVGDLIELDYTYPVVPSGIPNKVEFKSTTLGAVVKSPLGFRAVQTPLLLGVGTIAFYFEAKKAGEETVTLIIDGAEYEYRFKVRGK